MPGSAKLFPIRNTEVTNLCVFTLRSMTATLPLSLVEALITEMRKRKIILPAIYAVEHLAWAVRERAHRGVPPHCHQANFPKYPLNEKFVFFIEPTFIFIVLGNN
ncbi:hypothetical protein COD90_29530 [Bacillus cereus]|nr:hypothetical protein COD90_29530 [Bacillus cereus]